MPKLILIDAKPRDQQPRWRSDWLYVLAILVALGLAVTLPWWWP